MSACTGSGTPADPDYRAGRDVFSTCASCHGKQGEGGVGPALTTVLETFPDCSEHQLWIQLGSERWKAEVGSTYGAANTPVEKVMPEFGTSLTPDQLKQTALYERVRFGGADLATEKEACGLG